MAKFNPELWKEQSERAVVFKRKNNNSAIKQYTIKQYRKICPNVNADISLAERIALYVEREKVEQRMEITEMVVSGLKELVKKGLVRKLNTG